MGMPYCRSHSLSQRFVVPGGAQRLPGGWLQRLLVAAWMRSYVVVLVVTLLGTGIGVGAFLASVALPPILLFVGLSVLGCLEGWLAWCFAAVWVGGWWAASVLLVLAWW